MLVLKLIWQIISLLLFIIGIIWLILTEGSNPLAALPLFLSMFGLASVLGGIFDDIGARDETRGY
jgi:hypothetical protein